MIYKYFILALAFLFGNAQATTYYISNSGSNSNSGTSTGSPWQTLSTLSSRSLSPGDQVLLNRGDRFEENLPITDSGNSSNQITYGAYGTGAKPQITGGQVITGWSTNSTYGWQSTESTSINHLFLDGIRQAEARWPNVGFGNFIGQNPPNCTQFSSNLITQPSGYWTGARLWIQNANYYIDDKIITNHVGNTIYWSGNTDLFCNQSAGSFFYIEGRLQELDYPGEWYQSGSTVYLNWANDPDNHEVIGTAGGTAITANGEDYITIEDIEISYWSGIGANLNSSADGWIFDNVDFIGIDSNAIESDSNGADNLTVQNGTFNQVLGYGMRMRAGSGLLIDNNSFSYMGGDETRHSRPNGAIFCRESNATISNNTIDRTGYSAVWIGELLSNVIVEDNEISNYMMTLNDGGAVYYSYSLVGNNNYLRRNYIHDAYPKSNFNTVVGFYPDMNATNVIAQNNLFVNAGDYQVACNRCRNNIIRYNTFVNTLSRFVQNIHLGAVGAGQTENNQIYGNILYNASTSQNAYTIEDVNYTISQRGVSVLDYNLHYMPNKSQPICLRTSGYSCANPGANAMAFSVAQLAASSTWPNFADNSYQSDPDFVDTANLLYSLDTGSDGIDNGNISAYPGVDIDSTVRYVGSGPDIGACEGTDGNTFCGEGTAPQPGEGWSGPYNGPYFAGQSVYPAGSTRYAQYEVEFTRPTPTAGHGVDCDTSQSQVNSGASDEFFITPNGTGGTDQWGAIHNSSHSYTKIFVCPGDYSRSGLYGGSTGDEIQIIQGGTDASSDHDPDSTWVYFIWWDDDDTNDDTNPYNWASSKRAILPRIEFQNVSAIVMDSFVHVGYPAESVPFELSGTSDILFNNAYINPTLLSSSDDGSAMEVSGTNSYTTVQRSAITGCGYVAGTAYSGLVMTDYSRFVNNEIWDCTDNISAECTSDCEREGVIIENNDIYYSSASYTSLNGASGVDESPASGSPTGSGDYMCAENSIEARYAHPSDSSGGNRWYIIGNRLWGSRPGFEGTGCRCGSDNDWRNEAIHLSDQATNMYIGGNFFFDLGTSGIGIQADVGTGASRLSLNGNLFHGITNVDARSTGTSGTCGSSLFPIDIGAIELRDIAASDEIRFNSIIDVSTSYSGNAYAILQADSSNMDNECNLFIDDADWGPILSLSGFINDNAFIGTTEVAVTDEQVDDFVENLSTWTASTAYSTGDFVKTGGTCTAGEGNGCFLYVAENDGTSGSSVSWSTILGNTVVDNDIVWRAVLGPTCFKYKGQTGPENKCLPYMIPYSGKDDWNICAQLVGDRPSFGVDDLTIDLR